jgi:hypothetical protein
VVGLLLSLVLHAPAVVDERPLADAVAVDGDAACLERARLAALVGSWLGRDRLDRRLDVIAREREDALAFELRRDGEVRVERTISPVPADCADRQAALALAISLAIDASVLENIVPTPAPTPSPVEPAPTPVRAAPAPRATGAPAQHRLRVALLFGPVALLEVLDHAAFGGELGVELRPLEFLDLRAGALAAGGLPIGLAGGSIAPVLAGGRADVCPGRSFARERVRLRVCVGLAAAAASARGRDLPQTRRTTLPWAAVLAGGEAEVALGRGVGLRASASLVAPFVRPSFVALDAANQIAARADTPALGVALALGFSVRLR